MDKEEMDRRNKLNDKRLKETRQKLEKSDYIIKHYHTPTSLTYYIVSVILGLAAIGLAYSIFKG